jgi:hypothetical protein
MILLRLIDFLRQIDFIETNRFFKTDLGRNMDQMLLVKDQIIAAEKDLKGTRERS